MENFLVKQSVGMGWDIMDYSTQYAIIFHHPATKGMHIDNLL
jgi:hypothetical protein